MTLYIILISSLTIMALIVFGAIDKKPDMTIRKRTWGNK